jgi:hypothetical protein
MGYCQITYEKDGPKAPTAVHGPLGITYHPNEKAQVIADYLENQFTFRDLCDKNHELCPHLKTTPRCENMTL